VTATTPGMSDRIALSLIAAVWVTLVLAVNPIGDFPLNDDWIYGGAVRSILSGNGFHIPGPTIANILSQVVWGVAFCWTFGFSYTVLRLSTLVLALLGLASFHALIRENGGDRRVAAVATLALAVDPLWFAPAESFMTDVPFLALMIVSLHLLTRALREDSRSAFLGGVIVSFLAILTRQIGVAPLAAYAVCFALRHRFRIGPTMRGAIPVAMGGALHLAYQAWLTSTGRGPEIYVAGAGALVPRDLGQLISVSIHFTIYALPYIGLAVLPLVALSGVLPRALRRTRAFPITVACLAAACVAAVTILWLRNDLLPFLGNVILESGIGPLTQRDTYLLRQNLPPVTDWTSAFWLASTACGLLGVVALLAMGGNGGAGLAVRVWRRRPEPNDWLWLMAAVTGVVYWAAILLLLNSNGYFFDRYLLPLVPIALILLMRGGAESGPAFGSIWRTGAASLILVLIGGLTVAATRDYLEWNRTRWIALRHLTNDLNIPATRIDGGYEFNGTYLYQPGLHSPPGKSYWWVHEDDYVLGSGPLPGYLEVAVYPVSKWLRTGPRQVVVLRRSDLKE
jgi:hypothetical protein